MLNTFLHCILATILFVIGCVVFFITYAISTKYMNTDYAVMAFNSMVYVLWFYAGFLWNKRS